MSSRLERFKNLARNKQISIALGLVLIISGLALAGYPAYLWAEGRWEQHKLSQELEEPFIVLPEEHYTGPLQPGEPGALPDAGDIDLPVWTSYPPTRLSIPKLDVEVMVVAVKNLDIFAQRLNHPPGYYPTSVYPGQSGNVTIAGHRTGPANYFRQLNRLRAGDLIYLQADHFSFRYQVEWVRVVDPTDWSVVAPTDYPALTLTTCERVGAVSNAKRLIVRASFVDIIINVQE